MSLEMAAIFGIVFMLIYLITCLFSKNKVIQIIHLLQNFFIGSSTILGANIFLKSVLNECEMLADEALALGFGGLAIIVFAIVSLDFTLRAANPSEA